MAYSRYRREGLPISGALVESLIKQFNYRLKGTEKFWRSACCSDGQWTTHGERTVAIRLYLIDPCNPLVSLTHVKENGWNRYRVWKLRDLPALTPPEREITNRATGGIEKSVSTRRTFSSLLP